MSDDSLVLTYDDIRVLPEGLRVLQQGFMMQASVDGDGGVWAAQKAMDVARILHHVNAEIGSLQRNMELLLAQYGVREGQHFVLDAESPSRLEEYSTAVDNLLRSERRMPFEPIVLTAGDIQNLSSRPDALAILTPIVVLGD